MGVYHNLHSNLPQVEYMRYFCYNSFFYPFGFIYSGCASLNELAGSWPGLISHCSLITLQRDSQFVRSPAPLACAIPAAQAHAVIVFYHLHSFLPRQTGGEGD